MPISRLPARERFAGPGDESTLYAISVNVFLHAARNGKLVPPKQAAKARQERRTTPDRIVIERTCQNHIRLSGIDPFPLHLPNV